MAAHGPRVTLGDLPPAGRAIAAAATDAVTAAAAVDGPGFDDAARRLLLADAEHVRVVLGDVVRLLLEELHPDGVDGDDLREITRECARSAAPWFPGVDAGVLVVVLAGALGVHPDPPPEPDPADPWPEVPALPAPADVTRHSLVLLAGLLAARGRPLRGYLEAAFTELARRETVEQP
jgi:hypothetical protein